MKKIFFLSTLVIICLSFFTIQNNIRNVNASVNNSASRLDSGWQTIQTPDTEKFYRVYFKTEDLGGIFTGYQPFKRTTNGGVNWGYGLIPNVLDAYPFTPVMDGNLDMIVPTNHAGGVPDNKIIFYKTTNFGMNWSIASQFICVAFTPTLNMYGWYKQVGFIYAGCMFDPPQFRTNNGGINWASNITMSGLILPNAISYVDTGVIYGIFNSGIARCIPGGQTFTLLKSGSFSKICVVDSNNIFSLSGKLLYRSVNAGAIWDSTIFPVRLNSISFPDQNTGYITGARGKIYKSTNKGASWFSQTTSTADSLVDCCFLNSLTGYVIGYNGTLLKTNTGGSEPLFSVSGNVRYSDNNQPATNGYVKAIKLDKNTSNIITYDSVQIQNDGSYTLTQVPQDSIDIGVYPNSTTQNDWVITYYPSTTYWQDATTLYPTGNLTNINIGVKRLSSSTASNSVNGKVMRLTDSQIGNLKDAVLYAKNGNTFVRCAVSDGNGVYHLPSLPTGSLKIVCNRFGFTNDSATVNVTSSSNIDSVNFHLYRVSVGIKQISEIIPSEYKLYQNYPNPFNPTTKIKYQITDNKLVTLKIYDILGKEVADLVNEKQSPGVYEVTFDGSGMSSGIYFYKLATEDFSEVRRMILIK